MLKLVPAGGASRRLHVSQLGGRERAGGSVGRGSAATPARRPFRALLFPEVGGGGAAD